MKIVEGGQPKDGSRGGGAPRENFSDLTQKWFIFRAF